MKPFWLLNTSSLFGNLIRSTQASFLSHLSAAKSKNELRAFRHAMKSKRELLFEPLEPRLLLNADVPGIDIFISQDEFKNHDILVRMVEENDVAIQDGDVLNKFEVIDLSNGHDVLTSGNLDTINSLTLNLGGGDDRITIDTLSFADNILPDISLDGGGGIDEVVLSTLSDTVWEITGDNEGTASGPLELSYSGIENLTGSAENTDTFILQTQGNLSGGIDGGDAGYDVLSIAGDFDVLTSKVYDASSGVIDLDGKLLTYTGLEPITIDGNVTSLVLTTGDTDDEILLEAGPTSGTYSISSANGAFETHIFTDAVQSIVLSLGSGDDSFMSTLHAGTVFHGNITIAETVELTLGNITGIVGDFTVETISALHIAAAGELDWDGSSVDISNGANIDISGDFSVTVNANTVMNASTIQEFISAPIVKGSVNVGDDVTVNANNVEIAVITNGEREMFLGVDTAALLELAIESAKIAETSDDWTSIAFIGPPFGSGQIVRDGGSWFNDGFAVGQDIQIEGGNVASNQTYRILSVSNNVITVDLSDGATMPTVVENSSSDLKLTGYQFVRLSGDDKIVFGVTEDDTSVIARAVPIENPDAQMAAGTLLTFTHDDTVSDTIFRSSGDWLADGFVVGQTIAVRDAGSRNGNFQIADVTVTTITLEADDTLVDASNISGATLRGHTLGSFINEGFAAGDEIIVQGSDSNSKTYTIAEVYDGSLVLIDTDDIVGEIIDQSSASAPNLLIQVVKSDLALEDTPLVLMDPDGNIIETDEGELSFTQGELDAAYNQNSNLWEDILSVLADNPILDAVTNFGLKVWVSDLSGSINLGANGSITAANDVSITTNVTGAVEASTPSVVLGVSVVKSTVSSKINMETGASIYAGGAVTIDASADNSMESSMSVTSGSIQNPAQPVRSGVTSAITGVEDADGNRVDPTGLADFIVPEVANSFYGPLGFVRVPGPAFAVALGLADTDSAVMINAGSSIEGASINVASANQYNYSVSASSTIFQPGGNMGIGVAVAVSVTDTDSITTIAGDLKTHDDSNGDVSVSAESTVAYSDIEQTDGSFLRDYTGGNSVSSSAWVRNSAQGGGGLASFLNNFREGISSYQAELRSESALTDLTHENPGDFEAGAGISVLVSDNDADVIISSMQDNLGDGGINADGDLNVFTTAVEKPNVAAAGTAESGAEIAVGAGIAFARYDNTATTTILSGADLVSGGEMSLVANTLIPNNITLDETFYGNYKAAIDQFEIDKAAAGDDNELLIEAEETFVTSFATASVDTIRFLYGIVGSHRFGLGGAESALLTSYVNSGAGGKYSSADTHPEVVLGRDGTQVFNSDGFNVIEQVSNETQSADYAIAGNINILEVHNIAEVIIENDVTAISKGTLDISSDAQMETINMTGLTSLYDIFMSAAGRATDSDDGASVSAGEGGFGASVGIRVIETVARNTVGANVILTSNDDSVKLDAKTRQLLINISEMGADGGAAGIAGSVSVDVITSTTETLVDESAKINAETDVRLNAHSDYLQINAGLSGAEAEGGIAVGAAAGVNVLNSTTRAMITDLDGVIADNDAVRTNRALANIQAGNDVSVTAKGEEVVVEVALAGSHQKENEAPEQGDDEKWYDFLKRVLEEDQERREATQIGIAGAASIDVSTATVVAEIGDGASINAIGDVNIIADQDRTTIIIAGGGMLDQSTGESDAALAGAFNVSVFTRNVDALVDGAVIFADNVNLDATRNDVMVAISAGGVGSTNSDAAVAGAFNINVFDNSVHAKVSNSLIESSGRVLVDAGSDTLLVSVAGAVGINLGGKTGAGAAFAVSHSTEEVHSYIDNSIVSADGDVVVHAHNKLNVISLAASVGISLKDLGIAGQFGLHMATNDIDARIGAGSQIDAGNNIAVVAYDTITMVNLAGGIALGKNTAVGIAGTSTDIYNRKVQAHIDDGASVVSLAAGPATVVDNMAQDYTISADGVTVYAKADDVIVNIAVGAALSTETAIQGSLVIDTNTSEVLAYIGTANGTAANFADVLVHNNGNVHVHSLYDVVGVNVVGGVSASMGKLAIGASLNVSTHHRTLEASIGSFAVIQTFGGDIGVLSYMDAVMRTIVFNGGISAETAIAGAISVPVFNDFVTAEVMDSASLQASGSLIPVGNVPATSDISITAWQKFDLTMLDGAVGVAGNTAVSVSLGVIVQNDTVRALIGKDTNLVAYDTIVVDAGSFSNIVSGVGGVAAGSDAGVGGSGFVLVRNDDVLAYVDEGASLSGLANGAGFIALTNPRTGDSERYYGVAIVAQSWEVITGVAIQGGVGGKVGVSGAVGVSAITETTAALVADNVNINQVNSVSNSQSVIVSAYDKSDIVNLSGNIAGGATAAVGGGVDITAFTKHTEASLSGNVKANNNIFVVAEGEDIITSVVFGAAGGGTAAVQGDASIHVYDIDTYARIAANSDVIAQGSVIVDAAHVTRLDMIDIAIAGSGTVAVGVVAALPIVTKDVTAYIDDNAKVSGLSLRDGLTNVHTGDVEQTDSAAGFAFLNDDGTPISDPMSDGVPTGGLNISMPTLPNSGEGMFQGKDYLIGKLVAGDSFKGVAVTSTNIDDIQTITGVISGSGSVGVGVAADVVVMNVNTLAYVNDGAEINSESGAANGQQVWVNAGSALDTLNVVVGIAGGGAVAVAAQADIISADLRTQAVIYDADVSAKNNVYVHAMAHEDIQAVILGGAASGVAAVVPSVAVISLTTDTLAHVGDGAVLDVDGNLAIRAHGDSNVDSLAGALAGGLISGNGAGVAVTVIDKSTVARVGAADITVRGNSDDELSVFTDDIIFSTESDTTAGLVVQAVSAEDVDVVTFAVAGGLVGLAGGVSVQDINSDTLAGIEDSATINLENVDTNLQVAAINNLEMDVFSGAVSGGAVAGAGGVDVTTVKNDTTAFIIGDVVAEGSVKLLAISDKDLHGVVVAGAGGNGALAGAVASYAIGGDLAATYRSMDYNKDEEGNYEEVDTQNDTFAGAEGGDPMQSTGDEINNAVSSLSENITQMAGDGVSVPDEADNGDASATVGAATTSVDGTDTAGLPTSTETSIEHGTTAFIGKNAQLSADGIYMIADQNIKIELDGAAVALGGFAVGGSVMVVTAEPETKAYIDAGANLYSTDWIFVQASLTETIDVLAAAGSVGGLLAAATGVAVINEESVTKSYTVNSTDNPVVIDGNSDTFVIFGASSDVTVTPQVIGAAAGFAGIGGAVAVTDISPYTEASIGEGTLIGHEGSPADEIFGLKVAAYSTVSLERRDTTNSGSAFSGAVTAAGVGAIAGTVTVGSFNIDSDTVAKIGNNADVQTSDFLNVEANSKNTIDLNASGASIGLGAGTLLIANSTIHSNTLAAVGSGARLSSGKVGIKAGSKDINKLATNVFGVGGVAIKVSEPKAVIENTTSTNIGSDVIIVADSDVTIEALGQTEMDVFATSVGGGFVDGSVIQETLKNQASVSTYVDSSSSIVAGGDISINAEHVSDNITASLESKSVAVAGVANGAIHLTDVIDVTTTVGGALQSGQDIHITASDFTNSSINVGGGGSFGAGVSANGRAEAIHNVGINVGTMISGNATMSTARDLMVGATNALFVDDIANKANYGGVAVAEAYGKLNITTDLDVTIGDNASLIAGNELNINSTTNSAGNMMVETSAGAAVSSLSSGLDMVHTVTSDVKIDRNTFLDGGNVSISAINMNTTSVGESFANGEGGVGGAVTANIKVIHTPTANVTVENNAHIVGRHGVDLFAENLLGDASSSSRKINLVLFPTFFATSTLNVEATANITTKSGALFEAGPDESDIAVDVKAYNEGNKYWNEEWQEILGAIRSTGGSGAGIDLNVEGAFKQDSKITWDADINLLDGSERVLVIDENGLYETVDGITGIDNEGAIQPATGTNYHNIAEGEYALGPIVVDDIDGAGWDFNYGEISFESAVFDSNFTGHGVDPLFPPPDFNSSPEQSKSELITGSLGTFSFSLAGGGVRIENHSDHDLIINDIDLWNLAASFLNYTNNDEVNVRLNSENNTLSFNVGDVKNGAKNISILNTGLGDVEVRGTILTPGGDVFIINEGGEILALGRNEHRDHFTLIELVPSIITAISEVDNHTALIQATNVTLKSAWNIGGSTAGDWGNLAVDLLHVENLLASASDDIHPTLSVSATGSAYFDLGYYSTNVSSTSFVASDLNIAAGGEVDLLLQEGGHWAQENTLQAAMFVRTYNNEETTRPVGFSKAIAGWVDQKYPDDLVTTKILPTGSSTNTLLSTKADEILYNLSVTFEETNIAESGDVTISNAPGTTEAVGIFMDIVQPSSVTTDLSIDVTSSITVFADNDLYLDLIKASGNTNGNIWLTSQNGGIYDSQSNVDANIVYDLQGGDHFFITSPVMLVAAESIGSVSAPISVEIDGDITAWAAKNVNLQANELEIRSIAALDGDVKITTINDVIGVSTTSYNVFGDNITLTSSEGSIRGDTGYLNLDSSANEDGLVKLNAGKNISVHEIDGTLSLAEAITSDGEINIDVGVEFYREFEILLQAFNDLLAQYSSLAPFDVWQPGVTNPTHSFFERLGVDPTSAIDENHWLGVRNLAIELLNDNAPNGAANLHLVGGGKIISNGVDPDNSDININVWGDVYFEQNSVVNARGSLNIDDVGADAISQGLNYTVNPSASGPGLGEYTPAEGAALLAYFELTHTNVVLTSAIPEIDHNGMLTSIAYLFTGDLIRPNVAGANMLFEGSIDTVQGTYITGTSIVDAIHFYGANLSGEVNVLTGIGEDKIIVTEIDHMDEIKASQVDGSIIGRDVLNIVGGQGDDDIDIFTHGSENNIKEYVINVVSDGNDSIDIWGSNLGNDTFLMRDTLGIASYAGAFNMVSVLNGTYTQAITSGGPSGAQRINVSANQTDIWVHGMGGDDHFAVDDFVGTTLNLDGGAANDTFIFGQIFGSKRDATAQVAALDKFDTVTKDDIEISQSSQGVVNTDGGAGDNTYVVNANQGTLNLDGEIKIRVTGAALMPGELNELPRDYDPSLNRPIGENAKLTVIDTATTDVSSVTASYTAGDFDITSFGFWGDFSLINVAGLDDASSLTWSIINGDLIAHDGVENILKLEVSSTMILAGASGAVTVTATLMGAMAHEDVPNAHSLLISGIRLVATDVDGLSGASYVSVIVNDATPSVEVFTAETRAGPGEVITGTWSSQIGADGSGQYVVSIDGAGYPLDATTEIIRGGNVIGAIKFASDGSWEMKVEDGLYDLSGDISYPIMVSLVLIDGDGDQDIAQINLAVDIPAYVLPIGQDVTLSVMDTLSTDVDVANVTFTAGSVDLAIYGFGSDFGAINFAGLDNVAALTWSLFNGDLIAHDGIENVLKIEISANSILAGSSGTVTVTATLMGALAHEDDVNVDELTISGIELMATDAIGKTITQTITVNVEDALPEIGFDDSELVALHGQTITGNWELDEGADGLSEFLLTVGGVVHNFDEDIEIIRDGSAIGILTVHSSGAWELVASADLWTADGSATQYEINMTIKIVDADKDDASEQITLFIDVPAIETAKIEKSIVVVDEAKILDKADMVLEVTAGTFDLESVAFDIDTATIQIDGIDNEASINWSIVGSVLYGNDGSENVISIKIKSHEIAAGETGVVELEVTLLGALAHEDEINVDSMMINGIGLFATDVRGFTSVQSVAVKVLDDQPEVDISNVEKIRKYGGADIHSGSWSVDMGADIDGSINVIFDGVEYDLGEAIIVKNGDNFIGNLTVKADGSWEFIAQKATNYKDARRVDVTFGIKAIDSDGDISVSDETIPVKRKLVFDPGDNHPNYHQHINYLEPDPEGNRSHDHINYEWNRNNDHNSFQTNTYGWGHTHHYAGEGKELDDRPEVYISCVDVIRQCRGAEIHSGWWSVDMGADIDGTIKVIFDGVEYDLDEKIIVKNGNDIIGRLIVMADCTWEFIGQKSTNSKDTDSVDVTFGIKATDRDGDVSVSEKTISVKQKLAKHPSNGQQNHNHKKLFECSYNGDSLLHKTTHGWADNHNHHISKSSFGHAKNHFGPLITTTAASATPVSNSNKINNAHSNVRYFDEVSGIVNDASQQSIENCQASHFGEKWSFR